MSHASDVVDMGGYWDVTGEYSDDRYVDTEDITESANLLLLVHMDGEFDRLTKIRLQADGGSRRGVGAGYG